MDFNNLCLRTGIKNKITDTEEKGLKAKIKELKEIKHNIQYVKFR